MREILFRGKLTDNCEWAYGVPTKDNHGEMVMVESTFECEEYNCRGANCLYVDENTVGQYTGLTDKNGKKIFEGDILKPDYDNNSYYRVAWDSGKLHLNIEEYCFNDSEGEVLWSWCENIADYQINGCVDNCEVIGNIFDNPELLENSEEKDYKI